MKLVLLCAAVQGLFACGKEERPADIPTGPSSPENVDPGSLEFNIGIVPCGETFKVGWEQGDAIGLFAVESGTGLQSSGNLMDNLKLEYDGSGWSCGDAASISWPAENGVDIYAYYPYNENLDNPADIAFAVPEDQSGLEDFSGYAILTASASGVESTLPVNLDFTPLMSIVEIILPPCGKGCGPSDDLTVTLKGVQTSVTVGDGWSAVPSGVPADVRMRSSGKSDAGYAFRAVLPAQTLPEGSSLFEFVQEGRTYGDDEILDKDTELLPGGSKSFTRNTLSAGISG